MRQVYAHSPPPYRPGEGLSPPRRAQDGQTLPGRDQGLPDRGRLSPPRREPARGREGTPRYRSPARPRARGEHKGKKLELPLFHGEDPHGWLFRAERYFAINDVDEDDKVLAASVCMEGKALGWYQWLDAQELFVDCRDLQEAILHRFSRLCERDPTEKLMALRQGAQVIEYWESSSRWQRPCRKFPRRCLRVPSLMDYGMIFGAEVKMHRPSNLIEAMDLAQQVEDLLEAVDQIRRARVGRGTRMDYGGKTSYNGCPNYSEPTESSL